MSIVGIKELKNQLTRYLRRCKEGEVVVVTERGKPIACIRRILASDPAESLDAKLAGLATRGQISLPTRKPLRKVRRVKVSGGPLARVIQEDRR